MPCRGKPSWSAQPASNSGSSTRSFASRCSTKARLFGLLLVGPKTNGDPYTAGGPAPAGRADANLSLLLNQVRLKGQIVAAQEQELLGRMARGLAHDLNNLITPARTFLQLCAQGLMNKEAMAELLPVALRNVDAIRSYINEALFFSRNHRLETRPRPGR